jgi:DNA-binding transcriptional LysR family regulator
VRLAGFGRRATVVAMSIELRHLRYFVAVAQELHFGRAASRLGISQPPLSQQILILEREVGARLLDRTNRRVELTEAGRLFYQECLSVLNQVDYAVTIAERVHRGQVGEIKIGFFGSAPFVDAFQDLIFRFRREHPSVSITLQEMTTYRQIDAILEGDLDIGFVRPLEPNLDALETVEIVREPLFAVLRVDHPLAACDDPLPVAQLAGEPLITYARSIGSGLHQTIVDLCRNAGFAPTIALEANSTPTMMGLTASGLGISILPASMRQLHFDELRFRRLDDAMAQTAVWLARRRDSSSALSRALIKMAVELRRKTSSPCVADGQLSEDNLDAKASQSNQ